MRNGKLYSTSHLMENLYMVYTLRMRDIDRMRNSLSVSLTSLSLRFSRGGGHFNENYIPMPHPTPLRLN